MPNMIQIIQAANTEDRTDFKVFQQILLDIHEARKQVEDLKEIGASSEDDMKKLKESVVERAECAANKLDKVHDYLMLAFDNKMEIVLHKAQVSE